MDRFELICQTIEYEKKYEAQKDLKEFLHVREGIKNDFVKRWVADALSEREAFWRNAGIESIVPWGLGETGFYVGWKSPYPFAKASLYSASLFLYLLGCREWWYLVYSFAVFYFTGFMFPRGWGIGRTLLCSSLVFPCEYLISIDVFPFNKLRAFHFLWIV